MISGAAVNAVGPGRNYTATTTAAGTYGWNVSIANNYTLSVIVPSTYITPAKLVCTGWTANMTTNGQTAVRNFGFWKVYGGWFQAINGGVYGKSGIRSEIPGTLPAANRYLILSNAAGSDGLAYYQSGTLNLGTYPGVAASVTGYQVNSGYDGDPANYDYFKVKMATYDKTVWNGSGKPVYNGGADNYQIYTYTGNTSMNWSPSPGERVIYFIDGDLTVSGNISVSTASPTFLMVLVNGTITFNPSVTDVAGWWVGNALSFPCVDTASPFGTCDQTDVQFRGQGSFIGYNGISLSRDQYTLNNSQPAELFTFRPDLMINAPKPVYVSKYIWRYK